MIFDNGDKYIGEFVNGVKQGVGELDKKDEFVYKGEFKQNKFDGFGMLKKNNGEVLEGNFIQNKFVK